MSTSGTPIKPSEWRGTERLADDSYRSVAKRLSVAPWSIDFDTEETGWLPELERPLTFVNWIQLARDNPVYHVLLKEHQTCVV
jgi:hypothetical protein